jgi:hypothetical protein
LPLTDRRSPHRSHDALEPDEQHRCREVDRLSRLVMVALGRLARTEEREKRALKVELHEVGHGQHVIIAEMERALEWLTGVLQPVACDVYQICGRKRCRRLRGLGHGLGQGCVQDSSLLNDRAYVLRFHLDFAEGGQTCVGGVLGGDQQELCVGLRYGLKALARAQKSGECRRV